MGMECHVIFLQEQKFDSFKKRKIHQSPHSSSFPSEEALQGASTKRIKTP
ncbi:hypothetical protein MtrunA17_Chr5g0399011 [Medicago truncatula]|uniref:Uncharacterized protein n=1 Tax=Medicago truncatula TaxID=3880 RepID=A0A396HML1_MEDTR|nr:hypothetical protein MtrunA17_Chr5g0399011 [Medicago truncatula]